MKSSRAPSLPSNSCCTRFLVRIHDHTMLECDFSAAHVIIITRRTVLTMTAIISRMRLKMKLE